MKQNLRIKFDVYNGLLLNTNDDVEDYDENDANEEDTIED